jgi:hypothetical protein
VSHVFSDRLRCRLCGKMRHRFDVLGASVRGYTCRECLEWHFHAMDVLGGAPPRSCQSCLRTPEQLKSSDPARDVRMYVVPKDGVYQLVCRDCMRRYTRQRKDLYEGTAFGATIL